MRYLTYKNRDVVVVGNGISRRGQDLEDWKYKCSVMIGCNNLYKEIFPDMLVSADWNMTNQILKDVPAFPGLHIFRDKKVWRVRTGRMILVSLMKPGWSSGGRAVELACSLCDPEKVYLIGFDLDWTSAGSYNNMYEGMPGYKKAGDPPVCPKNFISQIETVCKNFPTVEFVRYIPEEGAINKQLALLPNMKQELYPSLDNQE